jgi:D-aminopeptidase
MSDSNNSWLRTPSGRTRARGLGLDFGGSPGPWNAITDVPGVSVGYATVIEGEGAHRFGEGPIRTGVTMILPRGRDGVGQACAAGVYSSNGNGELTGSHWIEESGSFSTPIGVTNTHAVGTVHRGIVNWIAENRPSLAAQWLLPVVAETWDGYLNDINGDHVTHAHVRDAVDHAACGPIDEGSVGGGTGMNCYGFKGGTGSASRQVSFGGEKYTVGVLLQCNFGSRTELRWNGISIGSQVDVPCPMEATDWFQEERRSPQGAGSVIAIVATDVPLLPGQAKALARRFPFGLARTGTSGSHFSGDIFLAFSTANSGALNSGFPDHPAETASLDQMTFVPWGYMDPIYEAVVQGVEEAVMNSLVANEDMTGRDGHFSPALPHDQLTALLKRSGTLA